MVIFPHLLNSLLPLLGNLLHQPIVNNSMRSSSLPFLFLFFAFPMPVTPSVGQQQAQWPQLQQKHLHKTGCHFSLFNRFHSFFAQAPTLPDNKSWRQQEIVFIFKAAAEAVAFLSIFLFFDCNQINAHTHTHICTMQFCSVLVLHTGSSLILPCNQQQCAAVCSQFVRGNFYSFQFALSLNFGHFFFSNLFFFCERALSFRLLKMNFFFFFSEIKLLALPSGGNAQTTAISKANCCI